MVIKLTADLTLRKKIQDALKRNGGYCPCKLEKSEDNKCICKEFLNSKTSGSCHCGLYEKVEV